MQMSNIDGCPKGPDVAVRINTEMDQRTEMDTEMDRIMFINIKKGENVAKYLLNNSFISPLGNRA